MNHIEIQFHFSSEKSEMMENDYGFYSLFLPHTACSLLVHIKTAIEL